MTSFNECLTDGEFQRSRFDKPAPDTCKSLLPSLTRPAAATGGASTAAADFTCRALRRPARAVGRHVGHSRHGVGFAVLEGIAVIVDVFTIESTDGTVSTALYAHPGAWVCESGCSTSRGARSNQVCRTAPKPKDL